VCPAEASRPELPPEEEPTYVISVAAKMVGVAAQTLRYYERQGLVEPRRSQGRIRLYSQRDVERLRRIKGLRKPAGGGPGQGVPGTPDSPSP